MPGDINALSRLASIPALALAPLPSPVEPLTRLGRELSPRVTLLVKRDDALAFGFGGNKVRKLQLVAARAQAEGADTLITCGGVQSNHARATAAAAARLGMRCVLIANGHPPEHPTANALLARLLGAEIRTVDSREAREPAMQEAAASCRASGGHPFVIPLGASTPLGAAAYARAIGEIVAGHLRPDVIVHATSSGGTQAGLVAGCRLHGLPARVIGVSADDPAVSIQGQVRTLLRGVEALLDAPDALADADVEVDDAFVGPGYGVPTAESADAIRLAAQRDALFLDPTYTAKAMASLIKRARAGEFDGATVLFWHTGGQVGLFA